MNKKFQSNVERKRTAATRKKLLAAQMRRFRALLIIFFSLYFVMMLIIGIGVFISLRTKSNSNSRDLYTLQVDYKNEEATNKEYKSDELYIDKSFYVPLSAIQELAEITVFGSKDNITFMFKENGEYAKFEKLFYANEYEYGN